MFRISLLHVHHRNIVSNCMHRGQAKDTLRTQMEVRYERDTRISKEAIADLRHRVLP